MTHLAKMWSYCRSIFSKSCLTLCLPLQVLQKLGKADETRDSAFEELVANFNKQMVSNS